MFFFFDNQIFLCSEHSIIVLMEGQFYLFSSFHANVIWSLFILFVIYFQSSGKSGSTCGTPFLIDDFCQWNMVNFIPSFSVLLFASHNNSLSSLMFFSWLDVKHFLIYFEVIFLFWLFSLLSHVLLFFGHTTPRMGI